MKARVLWQSCVAAAVAGVGYVPSGVALAQSTVDCSAIAEDMARLKCYDEQAARQKKAIPPATAGTPATPGIPAAPTAPGTPASGAAPAASGTPASPAAPAASGSPASAAAPASPGTPATAARTAAPTQSAAVPSGPAPAPAHSAAPAAAHASTPVASAASDFGLNAEAIRKRHAAANPDAAKEPDHIVARVKAVASKPRGEYRITLEDGQVWEETQHSSSSLPPDVGETVTIKRGLLGSYFLAHSTGLALRVKRIN